MYTNVILPRSWQRLACACRAASSLEGGRTSLEGGRLPQPGGGGEGLAPPARIRRGPTDLLRALAATVGRDPTAPHYKYHDDPYLIPLSNYRKRAYALSCEAGRKAAVWVRDQHADLFTLREWDPPGKLRTPHHNAEPRIDALTPRPIYTDDSQVTEEDLLHTIQNAQLEDAVKVFELLGGADAVREDLRLALLQLLCFYNEQPDSSEWLEERWFSAARRDRPTASWRLGGLADQLFQGLQHKGPDAYCALIQGMAKYYQAERAHALAGEARAAGVPLSTGVYNALISCVGFLREGTALRVDALKGLLREMNEAGLSPNSETLSACLRSLAAWGGGRVLQETALSLVSEFRRLGVVPGLAAYYHLLCLHCKERGPRIDILSSILQDLESRERLTASEPQDTSFFVTAMGVCSDHLQDVRLAERVHALLLRGDNYRLLGDAYKESIYYRHLVTLHCRRAPLERSLALLDELVPNVYVPEPTVMEQIIRTLEAGGEGARLAQAWSQLVVFGHARRERLVSALLGAMLSTYSGQEAEVQAQMRAAAADALRADAEQGERQQRGDLRTPAPNTLSADALCAIAQLCSAADEETGWEAAGEAVRRLRAEQAAGVVSEPGALALVAERAARTGRHGLAANVVSYLSECGFPEAREAAAACLALALNRPPEEVAQLPPAHTLAGSLQPAALALLMAYQSETGPTPRAPAGTSSSDSDLSSSDEE